MANRLQYESSPYLLQHAHNPVDWYPWGDEAFEKATAENKPVLISIGYAACHWCHVMERESFEDAAVAAFMNEHFICIKVDREEHPDVDHLYMDALQAMTGSGGWPLNMFVTPERKPFYGGTYFPPENRYGRISWKELLGALHRAWNEKPEEIQLQSQQMLEHLKQASLVAAAPREEQSLDKEAIDLITANLLQQADEVFGGFGTAPKFPASAAIQFLLEQYHYQKKEYPVMAKAALDQALLSIDCMIQGGIYDQAGGGFARYATDNEWLVPHFEKMLYDNALLLSVLSNAYRLTGKQHYARVIRETLAFCYKELGFEATGGFYCALDADSEGVEGKFYTWTWAEWQGQMGDAHPALAAYFGVSEVGNWEGTNILHEAQPEAHILDQFGLSADNWEGILEEAKARLKEKRAERVRPLTDEKQLLSWNALMNIALVDAGIALQEDSYLADAVKHMDWMLATFSREDGSCNHVYHKDGAARIDAKLDDYAYLVKALWYLAAATGRTALLTTAVKLMDHTEQHFLHEQRQFYYFSSDRQWDIIVRKVELYDGATPSANAVMMENLWIMGNLMENGSWLEQGEAMMHAMKQTVLRYPVSFSRWAVLMQRYQRGLKQLVIAGPNAMAWLKGWHRHYYPEIAAIAVERDERDVAAAREKYKQGEDRFYLCRHFSCLSPVTTLEALLDQAEHS